VNRLGPAVILAASALAVAGTAQGSRGPTAPAIFPTPQSVALRGGRIGVPPVVRLVTTQRSDPAAVAAVTGALADAGLTIVRTPAAALWVYVGRDAAVERTLGAATAAGLPTGGYVLVSGRGRDGRGRVVLDGADRDGQFNAAQTLRQLLDHRLSIPSLVIRDWPSLRWRGVVEGFYGRPWAQPERLAMLDFMGRHKLNFFMYGPKADVYLRARWNAPFPAWYQAKLRALVARAAADHVVLNLVLSPGLSICYTSPWDRQELIAKLDSAYALGVRSFTIALDDIDLSRPHCAPDAQYGTDQVAAAVVQASLLDAVEQQFVRKRPGVLPLLAVPTQYSGVAATPYTDALANHLDPRVVVQWTGAYGVSVVIGGNDVHAASFIYRHPLLVWDNYYVTDYAPQYLALGPLDRHDPVIVTSLRGLVADPMEQAEASRIGLFTVADYAWNSEAYDALRSWNASLREFSGGDPHALAALRAFADANWGSQLNPVQAPALTAAVKAFWAGWNAGHPTAAARLDATLQTLASAPATLAATLPNPEFLAEVEPWLTTTAAWAAAARAALAELVAKRAGRAAVAAAKAAAVPGLVAVAKSRTIGITYVAVAGGVLERFVSDAQAAAAG